MECLDSTRNNVSAHEKCCIWYELYCKYLSNWQVIVICVNTGRQAYDSKSNLTLFTWSFCIETKWCHFAWYSNIAVYDSSQHRVFPVQDPISALEYSYKKERRLRLWKREKPMALSKNKIHEKWNKTNISRYIIYIYQQNWGKCKAISTMPK